VKLVKVFGYSLTERIVLLALLVAGLLVAEIFFAMWTGAFYDMNIWFQTGVWMNQGVNIYVPNNHLGYPPLWAFWCLLSYRVFVMAGNNLETWRLFIKLPLIIAQFALAVGVWKFAAENFNRNIAMKTFFFTLTCSFFIYVGVFWGQINILSALMTFLAFYAIISNRTSVGAVLLGIAITLKIYPLITLPAFMIFILKNRGKKETGKFALIASSIPVIFVAAVFSAYNWNILYFLKTIFYWAPVYDANPLQFQGGCMNIWSFIALQGIDISKVWFLRFVWIPILGTAAVYWFRKTSFDEERFNLSLISFYILFMISYSWISEQTFLDALPFILLQIIAFRPKRTYLYALTFIQVLVYSFSTFNGGPSIFEPLLSKFSPSAISPVRDFSQVNSALFWNIRGNLGLIISLSLFIFLIFMVEPEVLKKSRIRILKIRSIFFQRKQIN
jgi:Gpi18-like mannosyltransferase